VIFVRLLPLFFAALRLLLIPAMVICPLRSRVEQKMSASEKKQQKILRRSKWKARLQTALTAPWVGELVIDEVGLWNWENRI